MLAQMTAVGGASPVSGAIGAVQAGQAQGNELMRELTSLCDAGMDVACFDLSQGLLEQHLDLADHLTEVCTTYCPTIVLSAALSAALHAAPLPLFCCSTAESSAVPSDVSILPFPLPWRAQLANSETV